jgi:hypothetical protein
VIIEWLPSSDAKTGEALRDRLENRQGHSIPVELVSCRNRSALLAAIERVGTETPSKGIPVLHIEAHGAIEGEANSIGFIGPDGDGGEEVLRWADLTVPFRNLNLRAEFNLLVVAAACVSEGALLTIEPDEPLPYIAAVTFGTKVLPGQLLNSMSELYRGIFVDNLPLERCVDAAQAELTDGRRVGFTSVPQLVEEAIAQATVARDSVDDVRSLHVRAMVSESLRAGEPRFLSEIEVIRHRERVAARAIDVSVGRLLAYDRFPENRARFGIDGNSLHRRIRRANPRPSHL